MAYPFFTPCPGTYGPAPMLVPAPAVAPWRFGLFSTITVIDDPDDHARNGVGYKSMACVGTVEPYVDDCEDPPVKVPTDTLTSEHNLVRGCPFHVYAALSCRTTSLDDMKADVAEVFRLGEAVAVETQIWNSLLATTASTVTNVDSTTANAFSVVGGVSALETAFAACYGGQGTIHAPRGLMAYLARDRQVVLVGDHWETPLGTKVAFYGGSPNSSPVGVDAPLGFAWMYITPEVTLRRFGIDILPDAVANRLLFDAETGDLTNEPFMLAERTYVPSTECCRFAALVELV